MCVPSSGCPFAINLFAAPTPGEPPADNQREAIAALRGDFEQLGLPAPERIAPPYAPIAPGRSRRSATFGRRRSPFTSET